MLINEIFCSVNGESARAGKRTVFIRAFGCDLRCSYCFGVKTGRVNPKLRLGYKDKEYHGDHKVKLSEIKKGDWIMTYDSDMNLVETQIVELSTREVLQWYQVTIGGIMYYITGDHPIFTINGIKRVDELQVGDWILDCSPNKYLSYMSTVRNCMKDAEVAKKNAASHDYADVGRKQHETKQKVFLQLKELIDSQIPQSEWPDICMQYYNAFMNCEYKKSEEYRMRMRLQRLGDKNPNWNPNVVHRPNFEYLKQQVKKGKITRSQLSGKTLEEDDAKKFIVHHIDHNHDNDSWDNLIVVTSREHNQIHQRGYSFWKSERKDGKRLSTLVQNNGKEVQKIKYVDISNHPHLGRHYGPDPLTVYTLKCEPYNTYLIDDMWVHNCDSLYAVEGRDYKEMSISEILSAVKRFNCNRITFTGGEPLLQKDALDLICALNSDNYEIEIETNGARDLHKLLSFVSSGKLSNSILITMDWKCPSSGMNSKMLRSNLDVLRESDVVKCVVGCLNDLREMEEISKITPAQVYVSPVFGNIEPKQIAEYIIEHELNNVTMQLQQHKIIWEPNKRGV